MDTFFRMQVLVIFINHNNLTLWDLLSSDRLSFLQLKLWLFASLSQLQQQQRWKRSETSKNTTTIPLQYYLVGNKIENDVFKTWNVENKKNEIN